MVRAELLTRAQAGDQDAFRELVGPHRRELEVHCYRMLGSAQDAEDALQETLLSAWQALSGYEARASLRTWLYQVATSRCLNALRSASRRPQASWRTPGVSPPAPTRLGEVTWLEPYPDVLLEGLTDHAPGPEARYEARESISLAFITALQLLPPRQRAVLILRDVLGYPAIEAAGLLGSTQESVTSALKRARATLQRRLPAPDQAAPPPAPGSASEQELVERLTVAYQAGDIDGLVALLAEDVLMAMPPVPLEYQGLRPVTDFMRTVTFREGRTYRLVPTRANGQPAFGPYVVDPHSGLWHANGLVVLTLAGSKVSGLTRFDNSVLPRFGLPRTLPHSRG
jgi:RNA polymerase sigma-70 factor (TIGR02960 family)